MEKQQILVTGGAGFIGSHLCKRLVERGDKVICLDVFNQFYNPAIKEENVRRLKEHSDFTLIRGDILDKELLKKIFAENKISKIVHLAALPGVRTSFISPEKYIDIDIKGTVNLLEMARKNYVSQFIFGSSSSVYGVGSEVPFREDEKNMVTISPYSSSKRAAEYFCQTYHEIYKTPMTLLRFFTVYGPRQRPEMAIHKFVRFIKRGKIIPMFGDGESARDYTYIDDIIEGVMKSVDNVFDFEIFNLGNSNTVKLKEMIKTLGEKLNLEPRVEQKPLEPGDIPITFADVSKAKRMLDWQPQTSFEQGVEKFIDWHNRNEQFLNQLNLEETKL